MSGPFLWSGRPDLNRGLDRLVRQLEEQVADFRAAEAISSSPRRTLPAGGIDVKLAAFWPETQLAP
jgi:hypothetical protein